MLINQPARAAAAPSDTLRHYVDLCSAPGRVGPDIYSRKILLPFAPPARLLSIFVDSEAKINPLFLSSEVPEGSFLDPRGRRTRWAAATTETMMMTKSDSGAGPERLGA